MATTVVEKYLGRRGSDTDRSLTYIVTGTDSDQTAIDDTLTASPTTHEGFNRRSVSVTQLHDDIWETTVSYSEFERLDRPVPETTDVKFSFATTTSNTTFKQHRSNVTVTSAAGFTAPDFKGGMGVTSDGQVEGVPVELPVSSFRYSAFFPNATVSAAYIVTATEMVGKVCSANFKGKVAGEVLLRGVSGSQRTADDWEVTYDFGFRKNETGITIGGIGPFNKEGWDVLWMYFEEEADATAGKMIKIPKAAVVDRVYERADFTTLGLGS